MNKKQLEARVTELEHLLAAKPEPVDVDAETFLPILTERLDTLVFKGRTTFYQDETPRSVALKLMGLPADVLARCERCTRVLRLESSFPDGVEPWCENCNWNNPDAPQADPAEPVPTDQNQDPAGSAI